VKNEAEVQEFERVEQQLHSMLTEMSELSKKKANDGLNKFKLKLVNVLLEKMNKILEAQKPFKDFEIFDENDIPTNSDVVVMLSQYAAAIFQLRAENTQWNRTVHEWVWLIRGKESAILTNKPDLHKFGGK
jgi:hypothetical protein